jgi:hypothetical protein
MNNGMLPGAAPAQALEMRPLFEEIRKSAQERLGVAHEAVMRRTDDYLFDRSASAADGADLTALRDLRRARAQLRQAFDRSVDAAFATLFQEPQTTAVKHVLNLLSEDALEEQLASEQMVDNLLRRHGASLELLDQRLAVVADRSVLAPGVNPIGPQALAKAMRESLASVDLSTALRIAMYKFMERELATALTPLYDRINARLGEAGILPRLLPSTPAVAPSQPVAPGGFDAACVHETAGETTAQDHALFSSLIGMLQSWRQHVLPVGATSRANGAQLAVPELMSALSLLQREPPDMLDQAIGDRGLSLGDLLRREVLAGARRLGMGGEDLNLSTIQEDAVDLVGMLFDVLLDERDFEPGIRSKIGRMLVPFVKVAVKDRRMFVSKGHPARRFLNAVAEACEGNHGDAPQEKELLDHVDASIDRLVAEFNEDVAIFEVLEHELRGFMTQQRLRVEIAERRAAETQRGRERLEAARARAAADVGVRLSTRQLPATLEQLLSGYSIHHLTQLALRAGADAEPYARVLSMLDGLLEAADRSAAGINEAAVIDRPGLLEILASSGCVGTQAEAAIDAIERSLAKTSEPDASTASLPAPVVAAAPASPPVLEVVGGRDQLDFDPEVAERMRALAIDTWVQLTGESGRSEPAKVSWISPISSRFLFVNRRGARVLVASAEELAAMEKQGRVHVRPSGSAFDNALQQIVGKLQTKMAA